MEQKQTMTKQVDSGEHQLENTWTLWYHNGKSDWTMKSYQKIHEFNTVEDFWRLYNNIPSVVNSMFFLMKKGHPPIWEVPQNIRGGAWLYKFPKKIADSYWIRFSVYLVGETLMEDTSNIIGISISPKVYNVTIRVWNCNSKQSKDLKFNENYVELIRGQPLYKEFVKPDEVVTQIEMSDEFKEKLKLKKEEKEAKAREKNNNSNKNHSNNHSNNHPNNHPNNNHTNNTRSGSKKDLMGVK